MEIRNPCIVLKIDFRRDIINNQLICWCSLKGEGIYGFTVHGSYAQVVQRYIVLIKDIQCVYWACITYTLGVYEFGPPGVRIWPLGVRI